MIDFRSPWLNAVAATVGGIAFGVGIGHLIFSISIIGCAWTAIGVVLLWWAFSDRRKSRSNTPESEANGSHTVE